MNKHLLPYIKNTVIQNSAILYSKNDFLDLIFYAFVIQAKNIDISNYIVRLTSVFIGYGIHYFEIKCKM